MANQLINSHLPCKHVHNPKQQDYIEIFKLIPQEWKNQINQNISPAEPPVTKVYIISLKGKWQEKNNCCKMQRSLPNHPHSQNTPTMRTKKI